MTLATQEWRLELIDDALIHGGDDEPLLAALTEPRMHVRWIDAPLTTMVIDALPPTADPVGLARAVVRVIADASDVPPEQITTMVRFPELDQPQGTLMVKGPFVLWLAK